MVGILNDEVFRTEDGLERVQVDQPLLLTAARSSHRSDTTEDRQNLQYRPDRNNLVDCQIFFGGLFLVAG